jgi:hypothetical protein
VNGNIDKHKAQELYYHFLIQYFPDDEQIAVLKNRFWHPNVRYIGTNLLVTDEGSLIWPPTSELPRRRVKSDEIDQGISAMDPASVIFETESTEQEAIFQPVPTSIKPSKSIRTIHRRSGESTYSATSASGEAPTSIRLRLPTTESESTEHIGSLAMDIVPSSYLEQLRLTMAEPKEEQVLGDNVHVQVKVSRNFQMDLRWQISHTQGKHVLALSVNIRNIHCIVVLTGWEIHSQCSCSARTLN